MEIATVVKYIPRKIRSFGFARKSDEEEVYFAFKDGCRLYTHGGELCMVDNETSATHYEETTPQPRPGDRLVILREHSSGDKNNPIDWAFADNYEETMREMYAKELHQFPFILKAVDVGIDGVCEVKYPVREETQPECFRRILRGFGWEMSCAPQHRTMVAIVDDGKTFEAIKLDGANISIGYKTPKAMFNKPPTVIDQLRKRDIDKDNLIALCCFSRFDISNYDQYGRKTPHSTPKRQLVIYR